MIYLLLADGFEEAEALVPLDLLRRAGEEVRTVGMTGKTVVGAHGIAVLSDILPEDATEEISLLILPGGMPGTTNLDGNPFTDALIRRTLACDGRIAAICAAPSILGSRGLLRGESATAFPGFEQTLTGALLSERSVVTSGRFTTAVGMGAAFDFGIELVRLTAGDGEAAKLRSIPGAPVSVPLSDAIADGEPPFEELSRTVADVPESAVADMPKLVLASDLLANGLFLSEASPLTVAVGEDGDGNPVLCDLAKMPHLLIAGAAGYGKSVQLHVLLASLLTGAGEDVRLLLIDPKRVELAVYGGIPQLLCPVLSDLPVALAALSFAVEEMERRYTLLAGMSAWNLEQYNGMAAERLPRIVIVISELADLMGHDRARTESLLCRIAQKSRAVGIHLVLGTCSPTADVLSDVLLSNIPARLLFHMPASRALPLLCIEAERIPRRPGDLLYLSPYSSDALPVRGAYISDGEIKSLVRSLGEREPSPELSEKLLRMAREYAEERAAADTAEES